MRNERFVLHNTREVRRASGGPTRGLDHFNHSVTAGSTPCNGTVSPGRPGEPGRTNGTAPAAHAEARTAGAVTDYPDVRTAYLSLPPLSLSPPAPMES